MHSTMLGKIHANHFGAESNIRMAREVLFWPGMRKAISDMCVTPAVFVPNTVELLQKNP